MTKAEDGASLGLGQGFPARRWQGKEERALTTEFIPLPAKARPEPEGPDGYRLQRAGDNGYVVISGFVQSAFVVTRYPSHDAHAA